MRRMALLVASAALAASAMSAAAADHELKLIPSNTHTGSFDARLKPVLRIAPGDTVKVEALVPFGVAPPVESRNIPNGVPGFHAGNLDFKELVPGASLYIPVHVPGALLSIGDGHAAQGDGEINGSAVETSLRGSVRVQLHKGKF